MQDSSGKEGCMPWGGGVRDESTWGELGLKCSCQLMLGICLKPAQGGLGTSSGEAATGFQHES